MWWFTIFTALWVSSAYLSKEWEDVNSEYNLRTYNLGNKNIHFYCWLHRALQVINDKYLMKTNTHFMYKKIWINM